MSTKHAGRDSAFSLDDSAGTLTAITADITRITLNYNGGEIDVTCLGEDDRSFLAGVRDCTIDLSGIANNTTPQTLDIIRTAVATSVSRTFSYMLFSGEYLTGECFATRYTPSSGQGDDPVAFDATLRVDGALPATSVAPS